MNKLSIYVKDANQRESIQEKYPDIDADFFNMSQQTELHDMLPMVCINKNGKDVNCNTGEEYIQILKEKDE